MTLIRELIDIPTQVQDGDFVLKLTQGIGADSTATIDNYVVTEQLAQAFEEALGMVAASVKDGQSKATYLQGSFGSGKSHFMAMLHLLLSHDLAARSKPELHGVVAKTEEALAGKKFLLVPVHFLGAESMEHKILGGYVERVQQLHPDEGVPGVFLGDEIVAEELPAMRERLGEEKFLAELNTTGAEDDWGTTGETWSSASLDAALELPATNSVRQDLVAAYIAVFRSGTVLQSASSGSGFVDLDHGLGAISRHAKTLGYDGVVLFLDELILWLASNIADMSFVQSESQKLTKLVEATDAGRPVPIVSFVARQRDLRELVGEHIVGAEQKAFGDNLELQSGRFGKIQLASGNLPMVAKRRLLKPNDGDATAQLNAAIETALKGRDDIRGSLLGADGDADLFRTVYPFSPALVEALVDVSEALQRERTALKVMLQLLVNQRDTLEVGQIIPVGDLWDVVAGRDEPFSSELKQLFEIAKKLWKNKLNPALESIHKVTEATPTDAPERQALANDQRLLKTVLLAALVPNIEAFRGLDAARLVALNWGSVAAPIKGHETRIVANKLRGLAASVGELLIGDDDTNPTVSIRLATVDTEEILSRAVQTFDTPGARRTKIRELIKSAVGGRLGDDLRGTLAVEWRGSAREVDVIFANVRDESDISDSTLLAESDRPKLVIDFPFDEEGRSPENDLERLDEWSQGHEPTTTICWLPSFLNTQGLTALQRFVAVDELLKDTHFENYTSRLSANQRAEAKPILKSQRDQLEAQLSQAILLAYGVVDETNRFIDPAGSLTEHYRSLDPSLTIRPTTKPTFAGALEQLCDQVFSALYPGHPSFESKIENRQIKHTWEHVQKALAHPDNRINPESSMRKTLRLVANPLEIGTMHESHFNLEQVWRTRLDRYLVDAGESVTVADARRWINEEVPGGPRGLADPVADLIILTVAAQSDYRLDHAGRAYVGDAGKAIPADVRLVPEVLPPSDRWEQAVGRAASIFGETFNQKLTGPELVSMGSRLKPKAASLVPAATELADVLASAYGSWGLSEGSRLDTARAARDLVMALQSADEHQVVELLAAFDAPTSDEAVAKSLSSASVVSAALKRSNLDLWDTVRGSVEAEANEALASDEIVVAFEAAETNIERLATSAVRAAAPAPAPTTGSPIAPSADPGSPSGTTKRLSSEADVDELVDELRRIIGNGQVVSVTWEAGE